MKRDRQSVEERQKQILELMREQKEVKVDEMAERFGVSLMTIRRDLQYLEDQGLVSRFYGGAVAEEKEKQSAQELMAACREKIAKVAASLVCDGDRLFINGSQTALGLLPYLDQRNLHVFTNNGLAVTKSIPGDLQLTLSGGDVRGKNRILTGDGALRNLLPEHADKAFIGCTGISPGGELLCGIPTELAINETMISHCDRYYILADHTKIGVTGNYASWHLEKLGTVITDPLAPADVLEQLRAIGMEVILAP